LGNEVVLITNADGEIVMERLVDRVFGCFQLSVTLKTIVEFWTAWVGVPVIAPVASMVNPEGNVPLVMLQL
jgi:hypothetical protein